MYTLSYLPTEVIARLLSFLSSKELASCTRLSKQFLTIIKTSSILMYILELGKAGLDETYNLDFDRFKHSPSDLLAALHKRKHAWATFSWSKHLEIPMRGKRYLVSEICGHIFTVGYRQYTRFRMINIYDLHNELAVTTLPLRTSYCSYAIDPGQDLLVLVGFCDPTDSSCTLHLRTLSTGLEYNHTQIEQPEISLDSLRLVVDRYRVSLRSTVEIFGDNLLFLHYNRESSDVRIVNWKTGQYLTLYSGVGIPRFTMISETEIIMIDCGADDVPLLKYCTISDFGAKLVDHIIFGLPFRKNPDSNTSKTSESYVGQIFSEASFTPKPFSPFVKPSTFLYPPHPQLINVRIRALRQQQAFDIFIHIESLRKLKDTLSETNEKVPWHAWGPAITRVFQANYLGEWNRGCLHGYRVLTRDLPMHETGKVAILDFNAKGWKPTMLNVVRDPSEIVVNHDGVEIKIISSLPYHKISKPFDERQHNAGGIRTASHLYLGDGIVSVEFDNTDEDLLTTLHIFQF